MAVYSARCAIRCYRRFARFQSSVDAPDAMCPLPSARSHLLCSSTLCCRTNRRGVLVLEHIHCGEHTALLMRDLGNIERHLDTGESAHQHQIVEMTEMADAEDPALELRQARAERHVEVLQDHVAEMVGVMASGHYDGGENWRVFLRIATEDLEAPRQHRGARGRSEFQMAGEDIVEPLLHQHLERFAQAIEKIGGRRVRPRTVLVLLDDLLPIPIGPAHRVGLCCRESLLRYCIEAKPGG